MNEKGSEKLRIINAGGLLCDGSIALSGNDIDELRRVVRWDEPFTRLRHPEVRYEMDEFWRAQCLRKE